MKKTSELKSIQEEINKELEESKQKETIKTVDQILPENNENSLFNESKSNTEEIKISDIKIPTEKEKKKRESNILTVKDGFSFPFLEHRELVEVVNFLCRRNDSREIVSKSEVIRASLQIFLRLTYKQQREEIRSLKNVKDVKRAKKIIPYQK